MKKIRVYLRSLEPEDAPLMYKWRQREEIGVFYSGTKRFTSEYAEGLWLNERALNRETVNCAICIKDTNEFIGCVFMDNIDWIHRSAHCPTFIGESSQWGKGYATDARVLMLKHAFHDKGMERIWAKVHEQNEGSLRMLEKCNFKREGIMRRASYMDGKFYDQILLSILREEFEELLKSYEI